MVHKDGEKNAKAGEVREAIARECLTWKVSGPSNKVVGETSLFSAVRSGLHRTMSLDKAKLCDSLLTWVSFKAKVYPSEASRRRLTGDSRCGLINKKMLDLDFEPVRPDIRYYLF